MRRSPGQLARPEASADRSLRGKAGLPLRIIAAFKAGKIPTAAPSLANRISVFLFGMLPIAFAAAWTLSLAASFAGFKIFDISLSDISAIRASTQIIDSLVKGDDGIIRIQPTHELLREMENAPNMRYAVFDLSREPVEGSSPELASLLSHIMRFRLTHLHGHFAFPGDLGRVRSGTIEEIWSRFGPIYVAVYSPKFQLADMLYMFLSDAHRRMFYVLIALALSTAAGPLAVRRGLSSLRKVEAQAARIDLNSLDQRLPTDGVPKEITSLVQTINVALDRLDAHVDRMRRFTANAAHELRTPLAIIRARLQNPNDFQLRTDIERDTSHLQSIVEQMLMAARLSERQAAVDEDVDLAETALAVIMRHMPLVVKCRRQIELENQGGAQHLRCNRRVIESVLANLIDNAIRAEPEGGAILVRVKPEAEIEVIDHGAGIAESDRELIFEPFWHKSETGTGLGLAIAKDMIESCGGRIWVEETPGGGATFKLWFPAATSETHANWNDEHSSL